MPDGTPAGWYHGLPESLFGEDAWSKRRVFSPQEAFLDLIRLAEGSAGRVCMSQRLLGRRWDWPKGNVQRFLDDLTDQEIIRKESDCYRVLSTAEQEEEAKTKPSPTAKFEREFAAFWKIYPRRVAKAAALKAYIARRRDKCDPREMYEGLKAFVEVQQKLGTQLIYYPHLATWLNQERWHDELEQQKGERRDGKWAPKRKNLADRVRELGMDSGKDQSQTPSPGKSEKSSTSKGTKSKSSTPPKTETEDDIQRRLMDL